MKKLMVVLAMLLIPTVASAEKHWLEWKNLHFATGVSRDVVNIVQDVPEAHHWGAVGSLTYDLKGFGKVYGADTMAKIEFRVRQPFHNEGKASGQLGIMFPLF